MKSILPPSPAATRARRRATGRNRRRRISELRLTLEFARKSGWRPGPAALTIDIVDYPGEWLLDLPLMTKTYAQWSAETLAASATAARAPLAAIGAASPPRSIRPHLKAKTGARGGPALHRLSRRRARGALCALDPAARTLPDAGRPRRLAGPDLRAAGARRGQRASCRGRSPP